MLCGECQVDCEEETEKQKWLRLSQECPINPQAIHDWVPISWRTGVNSKTVSMMLCVNCYHELNMAEVFKYRIRLE